MAQTGRSNSVIGGAVPTQCDPTPSPEDVALTGRLIEAGKLLGIDLVDHIVVGREGTVSLRTRGLPNGVVWPG